MHVTDNRLHELPELHDRTHVFRDRLHAGAVLAGMLAPYRGGDAIVLAIPAGGVPVAGELARRLELPLDVAVVSKLTLPWNSEAGFGALAFDGSLRLNESLVASVGLRVDQIAAARAQAEKKVARRVRLWRGDRPFPDLKNRTAMVVDDGLASGFTLQVAIEALRGQGAQRIVVAVPTAHTDSAVRIAVLADALYCPNLRSGLRYAVADAYEEWRDVDESEVPRLLQAVPDRQN